MAWLVALHPHRRPTGYLLEVGGYARTHHRPEVRDDGPWQPIVRFLLEQQEPYSALAMDAHWQVLDMNATCRAVILGMVEPALRDTATPNFLRIVLDRRGMLNHLTNPQEVAQALSRRIRREAFLAGEPWPPRELLDALVQVAGLAPLPPLEPAAATPIVPYRVQLGDRRVEMFSTSLQLGTPTETWAEEIRIECFFPMDRITREA